MTATAADDDVAVDEDRVLNGNLLVDNGHGPDSDSNGQDLTVHTTPVVDPSHGTVSLTDTGDFTYTPQADYWGADSFQYSVTDGIEGSDTGTVFVTVNPINDPPAPLDVAITIDEDSETIRIPVITEEVRGSDDDADPVELVTISGVGAAAGEVSFDQFIVYYTPAADFHGLDTFAFTLEDSAALPDVTGLMGSANITVTLLPVNDAPVAQDDEFLINSGNSLNGDLLTDNGAGVDSDLDGDELAVDTTPVAEPVNGALTISSDGTFSYDPHSGFAGTDSFTYRLSDGTLDDTATVTIAVNGPPITAEDEITTNEDIAAAGNVLLDHGNGPDSDPNGDPLMVGLTPEVDPVHGQVILDATGAFTYSPDSNFHGADSFQYRVSDGRGGFGTGLVSITITSVNDDPVAEDDSFSTDEDHPVGGNLLADNGSGEDRDVESKALVVVASPVTEAAHGAVELAEHGDFTYTPSPNFSGEDSFTYELRDGDGGSSVATVRISVAAVNDSPVANDDSFTTEHNTPLTGDLTADHGSGADTDVDGDTLMVATVPIADPTHGSVTLFANGQFTYTPNDGFSGRDSFEYELNDGRGGTDTATAEINVLPKSNAVPSAVDDFFQTDEDIRLEGNVLADHGDGADSDADGDRLEVAVAEEPAHGVLLLDADGTFSFQPTEDFHGNDSFRYELNDGKDGTDIATVSITVQPVNDPPIAADDEFSTGEAMALVGNVLEDHGNGSDTDVDGDALLVDRAPSAAPTHGTLTLNEDGSFSYLPNDGFAGVDSFRYVVQDGGGGSDSALVTITVLANQSPLASNDHFTLEEDAQVSANVLDDNGAGADSDPDADALLVSGPNLGAGPHHGIVILQENGSFTYTPDADYFGPDAFDYQLADGRGGSSSATVSFDVTPVNDIPIAADDNFTIDTNSTLVGNLLADNGNGADTDPDMGGLTVSLTRMRPRHGTVSLDPSGTFEYQPQTDFIGTDLFRYLAMDVDGDWEAPGTVFITVQPTSHLNLVSIVNTSPQGEKNAGEVVSVTASYTDISLAGPPEATVTWGDGSETEAVPAAVGRLVRAEYIYPFNGIFSVEVTISNSAGDTDSIATTVQIGDGITPPPPAVVNVTKNDGKDVHDVLQTITVEFNSNVEESLQAGDLWIAGSDGNTVDTSAATVQYSPATNTARWDLTGVAFEVDRYTIQIASDQIEDPYGRQLDGDGDGASGGNFSREIIVTWPGDTNLDLTVNFGDFLVLSQNFGAIGTNWRMGDFDANGSVQFVDFLALAANFRRQKLLPAAAKASAPAQALAWPTADILAVDVAHSQDESDWLLETSWS